MLKSGSVVVAESPSGAGREDVVHLNEQSEALAYLVGLVVAQADIERRIRETVQDFWRSGLDRGRLAKALGVSRSTLYRYLAGE